MAFSFHRIPVGICNCYLLRGERTILIDAGAPMGMGSFVSRLKQLNVDPKEISLSSCSPMGTGITLPRSPPSAR